MYGYIYDYSNNIYKLTDSNGNVIFTYHPNEGYWYFDDYWKWDKIWSWERYYIYTDGYVIFPNSYYYSCGYGSCFGSKLYFSGYKINAILPMP